MRGRTPLIFAVLVAIAGAPAARALDEAGAVRCVAAGLAAATAPDLASYLNAVLIHLTDPNLPQKLNVNSAPLRALLRASTLERIEHAIPQSSVVLKDTSGKTTSYPASIAPKMGDPSRYDVSFSDNAAAFVARYPKWNEVFRTTPEDGEGPLYREMYLSPEDIEQIGKEGLRLDRSNFSTLYFAGYHQPPADPVGTLQFAFSHTDSHVPVIVELDPAKHGITTDLGRYDGPDYFHRTINQDIPLGDIDRFWVFDKNRPQSESPWVDIKPQLRNLNARP